jgi:hypothetical protein
MCSAEGIMKGMLISIFKLITRKENIDNVRKWCDILYSDGALF